MRSFAPESMADRLERAAKARQALVEKFKSRPKESDPEMVELRAQQRAQAEARAVREAEKAERKAQEAAARKAQEAAEKVERERKAKRAAIEAVIRGDLIMAEQKAKRKARQGQR